MNASPAFDDGVIDVARFELGQVRSSNKWAGVKTFLVQIGLSVTPAFLVKGLAGLVKRYFYYLVDQEVARTQSFIYAFRGIRADLQKELTTGNSLPPNEFVLALDRVIANTEQVQRRHLKLKVELSGFGPESQLLKAVNRLIDAHTGLIQVVSQLRLVAIGAGAVADQTWEESVEASRKSFVAVHQSIMTNEEDDEELLELAAQAVRASDARVLEPDWAHKLSSSPYH